MAPVAIVVPTNRPGRMPEFTAAWQPLFDRHNARLIVVEDGDQPTVRFEGYRASAFDIVPTAEKFLFTHTDSVRNIGFLAALKVVPGLEVIITLDDDVLPDGNDPIQEHLDALALRVPISWFSTASEYMRGFPYGVRSEAEVWVSHGVWAGVHDYDAPTQLVKGVTPATFYRGPLPRGIMTPVSGMNLAFRVDALPHVYFAPMGRSVGFGRFGDIWMGIHLIRALDTLSKAMVSGYSTVHHARASDIFVNLEQEARGIRVNEHLWQGAVEEGVWGDYFDKYRLYRAAWAEAVQSVRSQAAAVVQPVEKVG